MASGVETIVCRSAVAPALFYSRSFTMGTSIMLVYDCHAGTRGWTVGDALSATPFFSKVALCHESCAARGCFRGFGAPFAHHSCILCEGSSEGVGWR